MPTLERAWVQEEGLGRLEPAMRDARDALVARGVSVTLFTRKRLERRQLALTPDALVVGDIPVVQAALRQLGVEPPPDESYPPELRAFLGRRVWASTLGDVEASLESSERPLFVKPREQLKRFPGFVARDRTSLDAVVGVSRRAAVWCAEVVSFVSEHRVYVAEGRVLGVHGYAGDITVTPDRAVVDAALAAWSASGRAACGYGIDFGVLDDGRTVLVELNEGYGLGNYGLTPDDALTLTLARWKELVRGA